MNATALKMHLLLYSMRL